MGDGTSVKGFPVVNEPKTRVVVDSVDGSPAMTLVTVHQGDKVVRLDNVLSVEVDARGRLILHMTNVEYHGPGAGVNCGVGTKPTALVRHPAPTLAEWLDRNSST